MQESCSDDAYGSSEAYQRGGGLACHRCARREFDFSAAPLPPPVFRSPEGCVLEPDQGSPASNASRNGCSSPTSRRFARNSARSSLTGWGFDDRPRLATAIFSADLDL